ncbi:MAG: serine hydrolase domain-containing protein [Gemmatimonadaceae bacterium]
MKRGRTTNGLQAARWSINLLLAAAVAAQTAYSQAAPAVAIAASTADRRAIDSARAIMLAGMRRSGIPGASVTVLRNGREIWSEGLGVADVENNLPVTRLTKFRIGSVSKPITAVAMAALVEEGKLDLDAPIQKYVPAFPVKKYPITARELAGHLAGIRHYSGDEFLSNRHYANVMSSLDIFKNDTLLSRPGDKYSYSTYGFVLLSAVVEGAAGEPFLSYVRRRVFDQVGMRNTTPEFPDSIILHRARFYTRSDSVAPIINSPWVDNSNKWAGGGFISTTQDLARFGQAMLHARVLKRATIDALWTPQHTADGKATTYGMGWVVNTDSTGRRSVSHSGGSVGGTALLVIYPKEQMVFAFLFNGDGRQPPLQRAISLFLR